MKKGRVKYFRVSVTSISTPGHSSLRVSSRKSKKRKVSRSPVKLHRRFVIGSPPQPSQQHRAFDDLGFSAALDRQQSCGKSRCSAQNRRPVLCSKVDCHNSSCFISKFENRFTSSVCCYFLVICTMKLFSLFSNLFFVKTDI